MRRKSSLHRRLPRKSSDSVTDWMHDQKRGFAQMCESALCFVSQWHSAPRSEEGSRDEIPCGVWGSALILFSNSTGTSTRAFSILAFAHSTHRSAATPRSIPVSQNEKFASYLVPFSFENSISGFGRQHNASLALKAYPFCALFSGAAQSGRWTKNVLLCGVSLRTPIRP